MAKLAEPAIRNLMTIVQANLQSVLAAIQSEYADGVVLPVVQPANFYFGSREQLTEYPAITFEWTGSDLDPEEFSNTWAVYRHQVDIDIWLRSDTEDNLAHQVQRYCRAVWSILYGNQNDSVAGGSAAVSVRPHRMRVSPALKHQGALFKVCRISCEIHRYDDTA